MNGERRTVVERSRGRSRAELREEFGEDEKRREE